MQLHGEFRESDWDEACEVAAEISADRPASVLAVQSFATDETRAHGGHVWHVVEFTGTDALAQARAAAHEALYVAGEDVTE